MSGEGSETEIDGERDKFQFNSLKASLVVKGKTKYVSLRNS
jgi:hypothetical protein